MQRFFLPFLVALSLLIAGLILTDWLPLLRGPAPGSSEWHWFYQLRPWQRWWPALLAALGLLGLAGYWLHQPATSRRLTVAVLTGLALSNFLLQLGLVYAERPAVAAELVDRALANETNGYFWTAAETTDLNGLLRVYPQAMPHFVSEHARTHPPGLVIANWLTIRLLGAVPSLADFLARQVWPLRCMDLWLLEQPTAVAAALGIWAFLPLLIGATAVFPAYALARRLLTPTGARLATILAATIPSLLIFAPTPDQIFVVLTLVAVLYTHKDLTDSIGDGDHPVVRSDRALQGGSWAWLYFFLAGLTLSLATFLSLGNGALLLVLVIYMALVLGRDPDRERAIRYFIAGLAALGAGLATVWLIYWAGWDVPPWEIARVGLNEHYELVTSQRRYSWWLLYNLVDLLLFAGLPLVITFLAYGRTVLRRPYEMAHPLFVAVVCLIIALTLSGAARGEAGRLWLFFMPLLIFGSAGFLMKHPGPNRPLWLGLIIAMQLLLTLSLGLAWRPIQATIVVAERPSMPLDKTATRPLDVSFAGTTITLTGYDLDTAGLEPGGELRLTLYWTTAGATLRPYTVFTHLLNSDGQLVAQRDNWPVAGQWPPTCWQRGERVVDPYEISLPADLPDGEYTLLVGLYDAADDTRLLTDNGRDAFLLTQINVQD